MNSFRVFCISIMLSFGLQSLSQTNSSSLLFNGSDGHLNMGDPVNGTLDFGSNAPFTMMAWINTTFTPSTYADIISKRHEISGNHYEGYMMALNSSGRIYFVIEDVNGLFTQMNGNIIVNDGNWHHITAVRDIINDDVNVYVDGVLDISLTDNTTATIESSVDFYVGRWPFYGRFFNGNIDDVSIWNTAMTPTEINSYRNCPPNGTESNLVSFWNFEETSGTIILDLSSNSNDGSIVDGVIRTSVFPVYTCQGVQGFIYQDINQNCLKESIELGLPGRMGTIMPGNVIVETDASGTWYIDSLPAGNYSITFELPSNWSSTCSSSYNFTVVDPDARTYAPNYGMYNLTPCTSPSVTVNMPFIRRCFTDQRIYVQACNLTSASEILDNGYVDLTMDELLTMTSSSLSFSDLGNGVYRFILSNDELYPGQCESFWIATTVSCNAVLNQTICNEANLLPAPICVFDTIPADEPGDFTPCGLPWDQSSISVEGWCDNDSIYFTITNTGDFGGGDMECYSPIRLFIDGEYVWLDSLMIVGGDTDTLVFAGDGRTWRLEVDQHPLHPGNSHPNATVELCGNAANWTPDLVNTLPLDDADPIVDIYCGIVTGSYDPNDKTGFPLGITENHYILPNGKLEYVIRFQNTGNDTAFTVVVRDTLDMDLDIFSVTSGVSSHNYSFTKQGPRVLEWTFNQIMLPDSTTDESGSNGFVTFTVDQMPDLPDGTEINNEVGIYFDYNDPIITNTTSHIINRMVASPSYTNEVDQSDTACNSYAWNNLEYETSGEYYQIYNNTLYTLDLLIVDPDIEASVSSDSICLTQSVIFSNEGGVSYSWSDGVIANQDYTPAESQFYYVTGTDSFGCSATDSIFVFVDEPVLNASFSTSFNGFMVEFLNTTLDSNHDVLWTVNGIPSGTDDDFIYEFTQNGTFDVCLAVTNECSSDSYCHQFVVDGLSITENGTSELRLYPNPANSSLNIELTGDFKNTNYSIKDATGKEILNGILSGKTIDIHSMANGIYFLELENERTVFKTKFVKN